MTLKSALVVLLAAAALASCGRHGDAGQSGAGATAPAGPATERAGPVKWNEAAGAFELNGKPLTAAKLWTFDGSTDGFSGMGSKLAPAPGQGLALTIADPTLRSPKGLNVLGGENPLVIVRLTRTAAGQGWDGALYYSTPMHSESIAQLGKPMSGGNPAVNETVTLVYDMSHQAAGAPDWSNAAIDQIRLDVEDKAGGSFVIHQVAIANDPDPAALAPAPAAPAPTAPKP